jgi:hypothetical protein
MELISDISSYTNPFDNPISNQLESISKNITKPSINNINIEKHFELDKIKEENLQKYNDLKSNIDLLNEVINELETKSYQILESIKYTENLYKESNKLYTNITR